MTPISQINQFLIIDRQFQFNSLQRTRAFEATQNNFFDRTQQTQDVPTEIDLINQLPHDQVQHVTDIFRSINIHANQALEPGLDFLNRENLQTEVEEDISEIRSVLDGFTQDDLTLFTSIYQNQITGALFDTGSTSNDSVFDLSFNGITDNSLESLFSIDVLTESGALIALDLTGRIIDNFTRNDDFSILESLLDKLNGSLFGSTIFNSLSQTQESEETRSG